MDFHGPAEDLWGNRIDLAKHARGLTLIQPFSPANCGYCLVDGEFIKKNYFANNSRFGGSSFHLCLFNPQLDIYSFLKHYREDHVGVLTYPPKLHEHHSNGFPFLIAFKDGRRIFSDGISPYDQMFERLQGQLWPDRDIPMTLTSPLHMGSINCFRSSTIWVVPDGDEAGYDSLRQRIESIEQRRRKWAVSDAFRGRPAPGSLTVKYEGELTNDDRRMHLDFRGATERFRFTSLQGQETPVEVDGENLRIGPHTFPKCDVGLVAFFPNQANPEAYVRLALKGRNVSRTYGENWVDYCVYRDGAGGATSEILLRGFFDKSDPGCWRFTETHAYGKGGRKCDRGVCPAPTGSAAKARMRPIRVKVAASKASSKGELTTLGSAACRFPSLAVDEDGACWVVWEEDGDILLSSVPDGAGHETTIVENGASDSFNPLVAWDGSLLWAFYLNDRDGFYRLYGRYREGRRLSDEILLSGTDPCDAITPAVAVNGRGGLILAWSDWKANLRYLRYRTIKQRILGDMLTAHTLDSEDAAGYVNAWYPSLTMDHGGQAWAAWNQHYPATLGVCSGNLTEEPTSVTRLPSARDEEQNGGYPSNAIDNQGRRWVVWESFGWDVLAGKKQNILASHFEPDSKRWTLPYVVTHDDQTILNQTPKTAVDADGVLWVAWSGRPSPDDLGQPWGIYLSRLANGEWSHPTLVSEPGVNSRAPELAIGENNQLWIAWHAGVGDRMEVQVLKFSRGEQGHSASGAP